jgi:hypothetical protein
MDLVMTDHSQRNAARLRMALQGSLPAAERILWSAQPNQRRMARAFLIWGYAVPWTLFSGYCLTQFPFLFGQHIIAFDIITWFFGLIPIAFSVLGIFLIAKPIVEVVDAKNTLNALTNRRIIRFTAGEVETLEGYDIDKIGAVKRRQSSDGWGGLVFEVGTFLGANNRPVIDKFEMSGIPDVANFERLLREAQQAR